MRDTTRIRTVSPLAMLGAAPPAQPKGPVRFCLDDTPERERPTLLRECFARVGVHYDFRALPDAPFRVDMAINAFPGLLVALGDLHGWSKRGPRELASVMRDEAHLLVNLKGAHRVEQRNRELVLGEGEATFASCSDPSTLTHSGTSELLVLRFPKAAVAPLVNGPDDHLVRRIPGDLPVLRLLRSYVASAWDEQADGGPDVQRCLVTHVYDLLALMIGARCDSAALAQERGVAAARLGAVKRDIARNLAESNLSVAALALRHSCTERSIQRMFEGKGTTFTQYVLMQRLARAHDLLDDPRLRAEKISTVALDCGFGDVSYFNRAFRRRYGVAPSDVRAQAQSTPPTVVRRDNWNSCRRTGVHFAGACARGGFDA
jgi:AraC-like DNA-binding protein